MLKSESVILELRAAVRDAAQRPARSNWSSST